MKFKKNLNWFLRTGTLGLYARKRWPTKVVGRDQIPNEAYVLVVGPHKTGKETVIVPAHLQEYEYHIMAKASLFAIPVFGWIFTKAGGIPVFRKDGRAADVIGPSVEELRKGFPILIFPESTRFYDPALHRGKAGAVRIALLANSLIVLAGLRGMMNTAPDAERSIHLGVFDPRAELEKIRQTRTEKLSDAEGARLVTDVMMEQLAELANTVYDNQDERDDRA
jgi:1-acyl-sn-glycerol-3-phosphate acyltransferase